MNNACFVFKPNYVLKNKNLLKGKVGTIVMPKHRSLDIDNKYDYNLSKLLFKKKLI
jgi:N-acylneuraminate cytidylyltransferase